MFDLSTTIIPANLSASDFLLKFDEIMIACGATVYDAYTSGGNTIRIYQLVQNASATGTVYIQYVFTTGSLSQYVSPNVYTFRTWNTGTHTGTSQVTISSTLTIYPTLPTSVYILQSDAGEGKFAIFMSGGSSSTVGVLGWVRPGSKHPSYDESTYGFYFYPLNTGFTSAAGMHNSIATTSTISTSLSSFAPISADNYVRPYAPGTKLLYTNASFGGVYGRFSEDWADVGTGSNSFGYVIEDASDPSKRYFCISSNCAVRIR